MPDFNPDLSFLDLLNAEVPAFDERYLMDTELRDDAVWTNNNSPFESYDRYYYPDMPEGLSGAIANARIRDGVGMDIAGGSNGVALRELMDQGVITKGLVTNLEDLRTPEVTADRRLDHISGNLLEAGTWRQILDWAEVHAPNGLDLIMHRPVGALQLLPPEIHRRAAAMAIDLLAPNGVLFTQIPHTMLELLEPSTDYLQNQPGVQSVFISSQGSAHAIVTKASPE